MALVAPLIAVPPLYHLYVTPLVVELAVNVTLLPEQNVRGVPLIVGVAGVGLTVTVVPPVDVAEQPVLPTVTV